MKPWESGEATTARAPDHPEYLLLMVAPSIRQLLPQLLVLAEVTKEQYTCGTALSFYRFRSVTLKPLYDDTFS